MTDSEKKYAPQTKWAQKNGIISKSYRIKKEVADQFQEACKKENVPMATKLMELMQGFIDEVNN